MGIGTSSRRNQAQLQRQVQPLQTQCQTELAKSFFVAMGVLHTRGVTQIVDTHSRGITLTQLSNLFAFITGDHSRHLISESVSSSKNRGSFSSLGSLRSMPASSSRRGLLPSQHSRLKTNGYLPSGEIDLYFVVKHVVRPLTAPEECSFVELVAESPSNQLPSWFVSHWWGEKVERFLDSLGLFLRRRALPHSTPVWICAYALRQSQLQSEIGGGDPTKEPFAKAIASENVIGTVTILDEKLVTYKRAWCCFEAIITLGRGKCLDLVVSLPGKGTFIIADREDEKETAHRTSLISKATADNSVDDFPSEVLKGGMGVTIELSTTSMADDKNRILNCIALENVSTDTPPLFHDMYDHYNEELRKKFAAIFLRVAVAKGDSDDVRIALKSSPSAYLEQNSNGQTQLEVARVLAEENPGDQDRKDIVSYIEQAVEKFDEMSDSLSFSSSFPAGDDPGGDVGLCIPSNGSNAPDRQSFRNFTSKSIKSLGGSSDSLASLASNDSGNRDSLISMGFTDTECSINTDGAAPSLNVLPCASPRGSAKKWTMQLPSPVRQSAQHPTTFSSTSSVSTTRTGFSTAGKARRPSLCSNSALTTFLSSSPTSQRTSFESDLRPGLQHSVTPPHLLETADVISDQPPGQPSDGVARRCPGPGCSYQITWHPSHCCWPCLEGKGHGRRCDKLSMPVEAAHSSEGDFDHVFPSSPSPPQRRPSVCSQASMPAISEEDEIQRQASQDSVQHKKFSESSGDLSGNTPVANGGAASTHPFRVVSSIADPEAESGVIFLVTEMQRSLSNQLDQISGDSDSDVKEHCRILRILSYLYIESQPRELAKVMMTSIAKSMQQHLGSAVVQLQAMRALTNMMSDNKRHWALAEEVGVKEAVLKAVNYHPRDDGLKKVAAYVVGQFPLAEASLLE